MKKYFLILSLVIAESSQSYGCNHLDFEDISKSMFMSSSVVATYQDASTQTIYKDVAVQADEEIEYLTGKQMEWELLPYVRCMGRPTNIPITQNCNHNIQYQDEASYTEEQKQALIHQDILIYSGSYSSTTPYRYDNFHTYPASFYVQTIREFKIPSILLNHDYIPYLDDLNVTKIPAKKLNLPIETDSASALKLAIGNLTYQKSTQIPNSNFMAGQAYYKQSALFITDPAFPINTTFE